MKAAVLYEPHQPLVIEEIRVRKPAAREVLLSTVAAGLYHSDLHFMEGLYRYPLPVVLGTRVVGGGRAGGLRGDLTSRPATA